MTISVNTTSVTSVRSTTSESVTTFAHTSSGGTYGANDRLLAVAAEWVDASKTITSITFNGRSLTRATGSGDGTDSRNTDIWYLVNPDLATNNIIVTWSGTHSVKKIQALNFVNVNQTTPIGATAIESGSTAAAFSTPITSTTTNSYFLSAISSNDSPSSLELAAVGAGQTNVGTLAAEGNHSGTASYLLGSTTATSYTLSYTTTTTATSATQAGHTIVELNPSPATTQMKRWFPYAYSIAGVSQVPNAGNVYSLVKPLPKLSHLKSITLFFPPTSSGSTQILDVSVYLNQSATAWATTTMTLNDGARAFKFIPINQHNVNFVQLGLAWKTNITMAQAITPMYAELDYEPTGKII